MATQSTAEKQRDYRARMALLGLSEVRGVYLPPALHAACKDFAAALLAAHAEAKPAPALSREPMNWSL